MASNSEDESRINTAENRAVNRKKNKQGKQRSRNVSSTFFPSMDQQHLGSNTFNVGCTSVDNLQRLPAASALSNFRGFPSTIGQRFNTRYSGTGSRFACGEFTHFRRDCPYVTSAGLQTEKKSYF